MNLYSTMLESEQTDTDGNKYPDICSLRINHFRFTETPDIAPLPEPYKDRFDIFVAEYYGISDYTDIILYLNNYAFKEDLYDDDIALVLPTETDIENYYLRNTV